MGIDIEKASVDFVAPSEEPTVEDAVPWMKDPRNPQIWSMRKRLFHTALPSMLAFEMYGLPFPRIPYIMLTHIALLQRLSPSPRYLFCRKHSMSRARRPCSR